MKKEFKKEKRFGTIHVTSEKQGKFINNSQALLMMQSIQFVHSLQGYLTTSRINLDYGRIELTIHFSEKPFPKLPHGYSYTWRDVTSHMYWSEASGKQERVRTLEYYFEYEK